MPIFEIDHGGKSYEVDAPDMQSAAAAFAPTQTPSQRIAGGFADLPPPTAGEIATDVAKSSGVGLARGSISLAGLPADYTHLLSRGVNAIQDYGATKFGHPELRSPETLAAENPKRPTVGTTFGLPDLTQTLGSRALTKDVEGVTGDFYKPQTPYGEYAETTGQFVPAAASGPAGFLRRLVTQAVLPAVASETAGQMTKGTAAEPYARAAGAIGGSLPALIRMPTAASAAPAVADLKAAARAGYQAPEVAALEIKPASTAALADNIRTDLQGSGFRALNAPQTFGMLDELKNPAGATVKVADIDSVRKALGKTAGNFTNPTEQAAANSAISKIDDYLLNLPPGDVLAGDAGRAASILKEAQGNWAAMSRSARVAKAEDRANLQALAANSGANQGNALRQQVKAILNNDKAKRGFSADEIAQMRRVVGGTATGNTLRIVGNLLGGGGGLGGMLTAGAGALAAGPAGVAAPAVGFLAKKLSDASVNRQLRTLDEMVRNRSPLAQSLPAPGPRINPGLAWLPLNNAGRGVNTGNTQPIPGGLLGLLASKIGSLGLSP